MEFDETDTVDTSRYRVQPLSSDNYFLWSRKMEIILRSKGLWNIVSGTELEPTADEEKPKYQRRKDVALTNLLLTIDDYCLAPVINLKDLCCMDKTERHV